MEFSNPRHPVWGIAKGLLACLALGVILTFSANRFDNTEIETIGWFAALYAIMQGGHEFLKKFTDSKEETPK
jgi:hypothetical protein